MERETIEHLLGRIRTDARPHCLCAWLHVADLVARGLRQREVRWPLGLDSEDDKPYLHSTLRGACAAE